MAASGKKSIQIPFRHIGSVQYVPPSGVTNGFITFVRHGSGSAPTSVFRAGTDIASVVFSKAQAPQFEAVRDQVGSLVGVPTSDEELATMAAEVAAAEGARNVRRIQETQFTCSACGKTWFWCKTDQLQNAGNALDNCADTMMCPCCNCFPQRKVVDPNKCPNCGSRATSKEVVTHEVS